MSDEYRFEVSVDGETNWFGMSPEFVRALGGIERLSFHLASLKDGLDRSVLHELKGNTWLPIIVAMGGVSADVMAENGYGSQNGPHEHRYLDYDPNSAREGEYWRKCIVCHEIKPDEGELV